MAQPPAYVRAFNFANYQASNPSDPLPGPQVDNEFNRVKLTTDAIRANLAKIQRDDGALKNGVATYDALSAQVKTMLTGINATTEEQLAAMTEYIVTTIVAGTEFSDYVIAAILAGTDVSDYVIDAVLAAATATSSVGDILVRSADGLSIKRLPRDSTLSDFRTEALFVAATIPALVMSVQTAGYWTAGDGGGHTKIRISTPSPAKAWHKQSADGAWWEIAEKVVRPQMFGAKSDLSTDAATAVQASFDYAVAFVVPVEVLGRFRLYARPVSTGPITVYGYGRMRSRLEWHSTATGFGIKLVAASQDDYIGVQDIGFYTSGTSGVAVELDFSGQGSNVYSIESRGHVTGCTISGATQLTQYFAKGIRVVQGLNVLVENNFGLGGYTSPDTVNTLTAEIGIEFVASGSNMVSAKIWKNQFLYWKTAFWATNVEGIIIEGNDFQANYTSLYIETSPIKNQIRIINNHLGAHNRCITLDAAQFFMMIGNEIFMSTADTSQRTLVYLKDVSGGKILGNTLRTGGSDPATYPTLGVELVRDNELANVFEINLDDNQFYDVKDAVKHDPTNSVSCRVGDGNIFHNTTGTRQDMNGNVQAYHRGIYGDGTLAHPTGSSSILTLQKRAGAALALDRTSSDGAVATFHRDGGATSGSISVTSSATTYNTSSDRRLKSDIRDLEGSGAFIDALRPRRFSMRGVAMAGFIADEFQTVSPMSVTGSPDAVDADGNPEFQAMQASTPEVMANVIAELQSLRRRVAELEAR